jgi:hypothetical protein
MNNKTKMVFAGFLELADSDKSELIHAINEYYEEYRQSGGSLKEFSELKRVTLGPLSSDSCPCCGR